MATATLTRRTSGRRQTPPRFDPMTATLVAEPFDRPGWVFEPKFDGLRVLTHFDGKTARLISRNYKPQEGIFPDVAAVLEKGLRKPAVVDGEVVCFDDQGRTSFRALQQRFHLKNAADIAARGEKYPAYIYLFDILWLAGRDLTGEPLSERKRMLRKAVRWSDRVRWTESNSGGGAALFRQACRRGEEGIMAKLASGPYVAGRGEAWVKIKCIGRQEFVVGGFTDPQRSRIGLGALLVGYYADGQFVYAGKVGTGFTHESLLELRERLGRLEVKTSPFAGDSAPKGPGVHWVRPVLVAEIGFAEWTQNDLLRQPRFEGLRTDKPARDIRRERPRPTVADIRNAEDAMPAKKPPASALKEYRKKRNFRATPEPGPAASRRGNRSRRPTFVIQEHHATRLHYDFRLEAGGVLKSWAITNEPTTDPAVKRLAVRVEDHPVAYAMFSGDIPEGQYGAGHVEIWDRGTYEIPDGDRSVEDGLTAGKISFVLHGEKLKGRFGLVRMGRQTGRKENWLLIKSKDEYAKAGPPSPAAPAPVARKKRVASGTVTANGKPPRHVEITNPTKVMFPEAGITKQDVVDYYRNVSKWLLPFLKDRPVTLERLPDGLGPGKPHFWQKHTPESYPAWIPRFTDTAENGRPVEYVLVNDLPTLLYLVNQGTVTFHPWLSRLNDLDRPTFVLFDLDPGPAKFADVVTVAKAVRDILDEDGTKSFVKTSGKSGLHVLAPWRKDGEFDAARAWALGIAEQVAERLPDLATTEIRKAKRADRVYVDVMQNARGHHAVPPYVIRPVPGATVSTPLEWRELTADLDPRQFDVRTVPPRLARRRKDPLAPLLRRSAATRHSV
jgi:bifunctional non-homologous end joining protein LigD